MTDSSRMDCQAEAPFILQVRTVSGFGGGPEKTILNTPRFLAQLGFGSACVYLHPEGDRGITSLQRRAEAACAELIPVVDRGPLDFSVIQRLEELCKQRNVAIWDAHDDKTNLLGLLVRRKWPMRLVTTLHGWVNWTWKTPIHSFISKNCLRYYDSVVAVSPDLWATARRWRVPEHRCHLIENAIDTQEYKRQMSRAEARQAMGIAPQGIVLAALGRLEPEKGFDVLINSVADLVSKGHTLTLWIGGEGKHRPQLEQQILRLGMSDHVHLLGQLSNPTMMLQSADIFVLSSRREGLPNVVLEAMALETPVIATRVAGIPRLITHNRHGLLVDIADQDQLANAVVQLAGNTDLRSELARSARQRIEQTYDFSDRMKKMAHVYNSVLHSCEPVL